MLLITTENTSKRFPVSKKIKNSEAGCIEVDGLVLRECLPSLFKKRKNAQHWVSENQGRLYKRNMKNGFTLSWTRMSKEEMAAFESIKKCVAQAWVAPPESYKHIQLFAHSMDGTCDARQLQWIPSCGSSTKVKVSVLEKDDTPFYDSRVEEDETDDLIEISEIPLWNGEVYKPSDLDTMFFNSDKNSICFLNEESVFDTARGIPMPGFARKLKFTFHFGTFFLDELSQRLYGHIPERSIKNKKIYRIVCKSGIDISKIKVAINSKAMPSTIFSYVASSICDEHRVSERFWKMSTSRAMRLALTDLFEPENQLRLKEVFTLLRDDENPSLDGKTDSQIYCEMRIVLELLKRFYKNGDPLPDGW